MELSRVSQSLTKNYIPVFGIESKTKFKKESSINTEKLSDEDRHCRVTELAYYKAEARGFELGHELEDWLAAEVEVTS
jgi:hypothetical protein